MNLRIDLLRYVTDDDILEEALANTHRHNPEPLFAKTGKGSLTPATPAERAEEMKRIEAFIARIKARAEVDKKHQQPPANH